MKYVDMYRKSNNLEFIKDIREEVVNYSYAYGIQPTAKKYQMSRNTVKALRKKYSKGGRDNLCDLSKRPKNSPRMTSIEVVEKINDLVKDKKSKKCYITATKVYDVLDLKDTISYATCNRYVVKAVGKKKIRKLTKATGGDVSWKKDLKPFERIQIDVKYLTDISSLKPYLKDNCLAKYEFTFRDICSGFAFSAYGAEKSVTNTNLFFKHVILPFLSDIPNLDLTGITFQTDNGTENTNRRRKGPLYYDRKKSIVTEFIENNFKAHKTIIPGHCTAQSDVESFHWTIERECLAWDDIIDNESLLYYVEKFLNVYNNRNRFKCDYTPVGKIEKYFNCKIKVPKPVILENFL